MGLQGCATIPDVCHAGDWTLVFVNTRQARYQLGHISQSPATAVKVRAQELGRARVCVCVWLLVFACVCCVRGVVVFLPTRVLLCPSLEGLLGRPASTPHKSPAEGSSIYADARNAQRGINAV